MLGPVEQVVVIALQAALPATQQIVAGAPLGPPTATRVSVYARKLLSVAPTDSEAGAETRRLAYLSRRFTLSPDVDPADAANKRNFTLPAEALAEVEDVQSPGGRMVKRGYTYAVDGRVIRFYQNNPPAPVEVVTRGGPAKGYLEQTSCRVELDVSVLAAAEADADVLLGLTVPAALAAFTDRNTITLAWNEAAGFRLRLLGVLARLSVIERAVEPVDATTWARCTARFRLRAELEMMVATGAPEAVGVIEDIQYRLGP